MQVNCFKRGKQLHHSRGEVWCGRELDPNWSRGIGRAPSPRRLSSFIRRLDKITYEEEADPEIFIMPYIWEVIVSTVTSNSVKWNKVQIQAFTILHHAEASNDENENAMTTTEFAENVDDVV